MLWWVVDNATLVCLFLGLAGLVLALRWRLTRQGSYLIGLGVVAALIALVIVLSLTVVTDRKQLVRTVEEVAQQINAKKLDAAFGHFADEVQLELSGQAPRTLSRKVVQALAQMTLQNRNVPGIEVWDIEVESVERPKAVVSFYLRPKDQSGYAVCRAECMLLGERTWRVQKLKLELPANWQVRLP